MPGDGAYAPHDEDIEACTGGHTGTTTTTISITAAPKLKPFQFDAVAIPDNTNNTLSPSTIKQQSRTNNAQNGCGDSSPTSCPNERGGECEISFGGHILNRYFMSQHDSHPHAHDSDKNNVSLFPHRIETVIKNKILPPHRANFLTNPIHR